MAEDENGGSTARNEIHYDGRFDISETMHSRMRPDQAAQEALFEYRDLSRFLLSAGNAENPLDK